MWGVVLPVTRGLTGCGGRSSPLHAGLWDVGGAQGQIHFIPMVLHPHPPWGSGFTQRVDVPLFLWGGLGPSDGPASLCARPACVGA